MTRPNPKQAGGALLETAMIAPVLLLLLLGMVELARIAYTYHTLQKILYTLARYSGTQQGVNFCDDTDSTVIAAKNFAITGTLDGSADPLVRGLAVDLLRVRVERLDAASGSFGECDCSITGCDTTNGGRAPDFIVADIPEGYAVRPVFYGLTVDPFLLRPRVRIPYGGT